MTNLAHWQDDIDDALGGEFDGSLSGLCIMSLSFDFTRNGTGGVGSQYGSSRENNHPIGSTATTAITTTTTAPPVASRHGTSSSIVASETKSSVCLTMNNETANDDSMNVFKKLKSSHEHDFDEENHRSSLNQNKILTNRFSQRQQMKNCLNSAFLNTENSLVSRYSSNLALSNSLINTSASTVVGEQDRDRSAISPSQSSEASCNRGSAVSTPDDSSRTSTIDARSPSPEQSCSSLSTHSHTSSRSHSPSDMSLLSNGNNININNTVGNNNNNNNNINNKDNISESRNNTYSSLTSQNKNAQNDNRNEQQVSIYSVKDSLLNAGTLKESSYTTSVITTTAPMHFKSLHHPFSLTKFPPSPYHQFSNSSFNHDLYDRYLSHDSHQPLQTPLIGIERTQDLLSLRLPPHGPDDVDSQKGPKGWPFEDQSKQESNQNKLSSSNNNDNSTKEEHINNISAHQGTSKRKDYGQGDEDNGQKSFQFNYKSNSNADDDRVGNQREPIDLNVSYEQEGCCNNEEDKDNMFNESMKHFTNNRIAQGDCCETLRSKTRQQAEEEDDGPSAPHQFHAQESMFGFDPSKQKFQYALAAPISVATKLSEDTMTYLNQGQAYEIKLENLTDESKKGFMCSIVNIGFHERHMQQAENELWQQWSQQHPNEKIFTVDMKLSYNVFGEQADGLNKYEFLWDSSKAAGVFIRINSISTEFTPRKHGGEKGVPFKLSVETFSYNSKTRDSYFISAACCQIKVFKPKGAERKLRSDRDKISKRPINEQDKYHRPCDHTSFRECSLASLHPTADGSLDYYRHSHGHFASKQGGATSTGNATPSVVQAQQSTSHQSTGDLDHVNNGSQSGHSSANQSPEQNGPCRFNNDGSENSRDGQSNSHERNCDNRETRNMNNMNRNQIPQAHTDYSTNRLMHSNNNHYNSTRVISNEQETEHNFGSSSSQHNQNSTPELSFHQLNESLQNNNTLNQLYQNNQVRTSLAHNTQHFGMTYYGHPLPPALPSHSNYPIPNSSTLSHPLTHSNHSFPPQPSSVKGTSSIYRQFNHDKPLLSNQASHGTPFKASSLALTSGAHNNFHSHTNMHPDCVDPQQQDMKDDVLINSGYQHDNYDSHLHHSFNTNAAHNQQSLCRQRSASTSMASAYTHCSSYNPQSRHIDNYLGTGSSLDNQTSNFWTQNSQTSNPNPNYGPRGSSNNVPHNNDVSPYSSSSQNYTTNIHGYESDQSSPQKNHNATDSNQSCYSRFKGNSSNVPYSTQDRAEISRFNPNENRITVNSTCTEVASWFAANRFSIFSKTFTNFSGSDLLRLSKTEMIEICGLLDGIRFYNSLHNRPIKPRRILYVCHENCEVFQPIYLYDVTLKELLRELSNMHNSRFGVKESRPNEKHKKNIVEKSTMNSNSSNDSRSSIGTMSETAIEDTYNHGEQYFNDIESQRHAKYHSMGHKTTHINMNNHNIHIGRLLINGLTSVNIVATEQVVQMLDDESVWTLSVNTTESGHVEACISACRSKQTSK